MKRFPVYLLWIGLYRALALWAQNIQEIGFSQVGEGLVASVLLCFLLWLLVWLLIRDSEKAGLIAVVALLIFFSTERLLFPRWGLFRPLPVHYAGQYLPADHEQVIRADYTLARRSLPVFGV